MNCPIDNTPLAISDRQGIEIDYCPKCRGVWLDRGELEKLIERNSQHNAARGYNDEVEDEGDAKPGSSLPQQVPFSPQSDFPQGQPPRPLGTDLMSIVGDLIGKGLDKHRQYSGQGGVPRKKKGGLLGELFDF